MPCNSSTTGRMAAPHCRSMHRSHSTACAATTKTTWPAHLASRSMSFTSHKQKHAKPAQQSQHAQQPLQIQPRHDPTPAHLVSRSMSFTSSMPPVARMLSAKQASKTSAEGSGDGQGRCKHGICRECGIPCLLRRVRAFLATPPCKPWHFTPHQSSLAGRNLLQHAQVGCTPPACLLA